MVKPAFIGASIYAAHFDGYWRLPETDLAQLYDFRTYAELARLAEDATVAFLFAPDGLAHTAIDAARSGVPGFEAGTFFAAIAALTSRIGVVVTKSTTLGPPYDIARYFGSLDRISEGRVGWNVVTTAVSAAARNFGFDDLPGHAERYERAAEVVQAVRSLLTSYGQDALVGDRETGVFFDEARIRHTKYNGQYISVDGLLNLPRSPQVTPPLWQAGSSDDGIRFAGDIADAVFTGLGETDEEAINYRNRVRASVERAGRDPDKVKILPGLHVTVADSHQEAVDRRARIRELSQRDAGLTRTSELTGIDFESLPKEAPLPALPPVESANNYQSALARLHRVVDRSGAQTVGDLERALNDATPRGAVGTSTEIADRIEELVEIGAADGFTISGEISGDHGIRGFLTTVAPELKRRGVLPETYRGTTLREHLGI